MHQERRMPLEAVTLMHKLTSDWFSQTQLMMFPEFPHSADRLLAGAATWLLVAWELGKSRVNDFFHRTIPARGELLLDDPFLIGLESDGHMPLPLRWLDYVSTPWSHADANQC
jgi:hypothetical protein